MSPGPFSLRIQHGITGGFAPPAPTAIHDLTLDGLDGPGDPYIFLLSRFPSDTATQELEVKPKSIPISDETTRLIGELDGILRKLPTEDFPSRDIYGRDIGIFWQGPDEFVWANSAPEGCGGSEGGSTTATEDDKKAFDRAVEITEILVKRGVARESN
ncbi:hypothetical protein BC826DRAFT_1020593 [Russula brevipes]|nr:hypothetical protein BC826DRAFT_1020593 [Russula brevipes]